MDAIQTVKLSSTLDPLPPVLQRGLIAVAFFGFLSLCSSGCLFLFLSFRLLRWYLKGRAGNGVNQFFILIYNLLLADIHQAVAFASTMVYVVENKIDVNTNTCWANGWFVSVGDLASGVFIFSIGLHTFLRLVKGRILSTKIFYLWIGCAWFFVYLMAILTATGHPKVYVRAGAWCWIDRRFEKERLWLHYFWIFVAMFGTIIIYVIIYLTMKSRFTSTSNMNNESLRAQLKHTKRTAKYMIIYPVVYAVCTLPLAGGRMAAMTGLSIPYWYYCLAGATITSCGWLDVALYVLTRRVFIFSNSPPSENDNGFNNFGWHQRSQIYGTTTTIEGPLTQHTSNTASRQLRQGSIFSSPAWRSSGRRHSDEDHFARPVEGIIAVKTTVEITVEPATGYAGSELSVLELDEKNPPTSSSLST